MGIYVCVVGEEGGLRTLCVVPNSLKTPSFGGSGGMRWMSSGGKEASFGGCAAASDDDDGSCSWGSCEYSSDEVSRWALRLAMLAGVKDL